MSIVLFKRTVEHSSGGMSVLRVSFTPLACKEHEIYGRSTTRIVPDDEDREEAFSQMEDWLLQTNGLERSLNRR